MSPSDTDSVTFSSPASTISSLPSTMTTEAPIRDELFYFHSVVFQAENRLFKVPRYGLPGDAAVFDSMFANATGGAGSSDDNPIRLDADISAADFRSLLKAAIPPPGTSAAVLTLDEWMGVLTLAKKWQLESMKDKAIAGSDDEIQKKTDVEKILLAKKYGVAKWLKEGYCALASRKKPITPEERTSLGWETYGRIMDVRERGRETTLESAFKTNHDNTVHCSTCSSNHFPHCDSNMSGLSNGVNRRCNNRCGVYHGVGCDAGEMSKDKLMEKWEAFDYGSIVENEFAELLKL